MSSISTPQQRFLERLSAFVFAAPDDAENAHLAALAAVRARMPAVSLDVLEGSDGDVAREIPAQLAQREVVLREGLQAYYVQAYKELTLRNLEAGHSYDILFAHTLLIDALLRVAFEACLEEFPLLLRLRVAEAAKELDYKREQLPKRREKLAQLERQLTPADIGEPEGHAERDYYLSIANSLREDIARDQGDIAGLEASLPALRLYRFDRDEVLRRVVQFARGGYGRAEMSFASDVDTGYCLDPRGLGAGEVGVYRELLVRIESILQEAGVRTAHQYFEIEEDLSRFTEPDTLHTIPSILESRALAGNAALLDELKTSFMAVLPYERFVQRKVREFEGQAHPGMTTMQLKSDFGGLRSIQTPLWLVGVTHRAAGFGTAELLELSRAKGLLSVWEVSRLLEALELLFELRNFTAVAEESYYDREAIETGFRVHAFEPDRIDDAVARLYLFRKQRFDSMDAFDSRRLRLVDEVQKISTALLERVLDRTISHRLGPFVVSVHLGRKQITAITSPEESGAVELRTLFRHRRALLLLMGYVARSGYELSTRLKDALVDVVLEMEPPIGPEGLSEQARRFSTVMEAPHAHVALGAMFDINDPLTPQTTTLIGCFMPVFDEAFFLLRSVHQRSVPLHEHLLRSVACGQQGLEWLRGHYPELYAQLEPVDVLALKWALLLQGIGMIESGGGRTAETAERAMETLAALGYDDLELERRVRLLIEHCHTLVTLSRTERYMDQAMARYFEIAERRTEYAVLLFLANLAILRAQDAAETVVVLLQRLFDEANQILAEMRGFPRQDQSLELINVYFDQKKKDLMTETRLYLLLQQIVAQGTDAGLFSPLEKLGEADAGRLGSYREEVDALYREIVLGGHSTQQQERVEDKLVQLLRNMLREETVRALTGDREELFTFFFNGYPNRYLMASLPRHLAAEMPLFARFRRAQVIADVLSSDQLGTEGVLIYTRELPRSHARVAYAMSRYGANIVSGKVNRIHITPDEHAFCYYFQISPMPPGERMTPRDLELTIAAETPPDLAVPARTQAVPARGVRVEFCGDDHKGYRIELQDGRFLRRPADLPHIRVVLRDEPFLFYKVSRAFELYDTEIQQSLITTTGNQVVDYFYLRPQDYERLAASNFQEVFIGLVNTDLMALTRRNQVSRASS